MMRILVGALVGGISIFAWGAVSHMALGLGGDAFAPMPGEERVVAALQSEFRQEGFHFFPGMDMSRKATKEEEEAWKEKYRKGPTGMVLYHPKGSEPMSARTFVTEFASNVAAALLAAILLARSSGTYFGRVLSVAAMGLFAWLSISVSYWNWYGFTAAFTRTEIIEQVAGWFVGGLALAAIVKPRAAFP